MKKKYLKIFTYFCFGINSILLLISIIILITGIPMGSIGIPNADSGPTAIFFSGDFHIILIIPLVITLLFEIIFILNIRHFNKSNS